MPLVELALAFLLAAGPTAATPPRGPQARVSQQVGLTDVDVEYESLSARDRGAGERAATIRFSRAVDVGGKPVAAGTYRLSATPGKGEWTVALTPAKPEAASTTRFKVRPAALAPARDRLTLLFTESGQDKATLDLEWDRVRVSIPIAARTAAEIKAEGETLDGAWRSYANAARYMLETQKDFDAGLRYADLSLSLKDDWYAHWIKAALLAAKHDYRGAVTEGERAQALGRPLGDRFLLEPELEANLRDLAC